MENKNIWLIYILNLNNNTWYTGITTDIKNRIQKHKSGQGSKYVRAHLPLQLLYLEGFYNKSSALKREKQIKQLKKTEKIRLVYKNKDIVLCKNCDIRVLINNDVCIICSNLLKGGEK